MNRYEKGQIYKIVDVGYNKMYIGSTTENLKKGLKDIGKIINCLKQVRDDTAFPYLLFLMNMEWIIVKLNGLKIFLAIAKRN